MAILEERIIETRQGRVSYAGTGDGPIRLLLHSLLTDRTAFDQVGEALGGRRIAVDLPGFGSTSPAPPSIDEYADRVASFIEAERLADDDLTLIGNGLGAFVALGTTIHHGELVDRLILVGCGAGFPDPAKTAFTNMIEAVEKGGIEAVIPIALRRIFTEPYLEEHPDMGEARAEVLRRSDPEAFITACRALLSLDYRRLAATVSVPTLIVVGEEDQATPPPLAEELHHLIDESTLITLPGVAHAPQIQDPGGFVDAIRPFLEGR
ncbi:MAG TPA: alpha/beta fold hydrolase [Acidimicrobiia bacterium]|nr:alpha/beta fold hydrolase [Acidimicrobiia bacterium]